MRIFALLAIAAASLTLLAACGGKGEDVRPVEITIAEGGCGSIEITVEAGQRLRLDISNDSPQEYEISAAEGGVETLHIAPGEGAEAFYFVPEGDAAYAINCMAADGNESFGVINAGSGGSRPIDVGTPTRGVEAGTTPSLDQPDATLAVTLAEYTVTASAQSLPPGRVNLIATNISGGQAHELNVLELQPDGSFQNHGALAAIEPQQGGALLVTVRPGTYRLACLIGIGESGSTVDHYQQGMWTDILVEE
jgi:uncharacterized cupredoxin-like copper-binding protein